MSARSDAFTAALYDTRKLTRHIHWWALAGGVTTAFFPAEGLGILSGTLYMGWQAERRNIRAFMRLRQHLAERRGDVPQTDEQAVEWFQKVKALHGPFLRNLKLRLAQPQRR